MLYFNSMWYINWLTGPKRKTMIFPARTKVPIFGTMGKQLCSWCLKNTRLLFSKKSGLFNFNFPWPHEQPKVTKLVFEHWISLFLRPVKRDICNPCSLATNEEYYDLASQTWFSSQVGALRASPPLCWLLGLWPHISDTFITFFYVKNEKKIKVDTLIDLNVLRRVQVYTKKAGGKWDTVSIRVLPPWTQKTELSNKIIRYWILI